MLLHEYLKISAEVAISAEQRAKHSFEVVYRWSTFVGFRSNVLSKAAEILSLAHIKCKDKYHGIPDNRFKKAMLLFGFVFSIAATIPILITDLIILGVMFTAFVVGHAIGLITTRTIAGLAWVFLGSKTAEHLNMLGMDFTEECMFCIMNLLRLPAGFINLIGLIPSFILGIVNDNLNYICLTTVEKFYNLNSTLTNYCISIDESKNNVTELKSQAKNTETTSLPPENKFVLYSYRSSSASEKIETKEEGAELKQTTNDIDSKLVLS